MIDGFTAVINVVTDVFLRLIKMIIAPLVFCTLVVGIAKLGDIKAVGRIGGQGLAVVPVRLFSFPVSGDGLHAWVVAGQRTEPASSACGCQHGYRRRSSIRSRPLSPISSRSAFSTALAKNAILQIVVFAVFFGIATASIGEQGKIVIKALDAVAAIVLRVTGYVMYLAPVAALAAIAERHGHQGTGIAGDLWKADPQLLSGHTGVVACPAAGRFGLYRAGG